MAKISSLKDLQIYLQALNLAGNIYDLIKHPKLKCEYSLCDQIKRASISVAANIAEGYGRNTKKDFIQFISISIGSANEVIAYLDFLNLHFQIETASLENDYHVLCKRLIAFRKYLQSFLTDN